MNLHATSETFKLYLSAAQAQPARRANAYPCIPVNHGFVMHPDYCTKKALKLQRSDFGALFLNSVPSADRIRSVYDNSGLRACLSAHSLPFSPVSHGFSENCCLPHFLSAAVEGQFVSLGMPSEQNSERDYPSRVRAVE
jgi:hypothetical protein